MQANGEPETTATPDYIERIQKYMAKALHEAKINTSWIQPNEEWDAAMQDFIAKVLDPSPRNKFLPAFTPVAKDVARLGAVNSLSQTLLKLTSPEFPTFIKAPKFGITVWSIPTIGARSITSGVVKCWNHSQHLVPAILCTTGLMAASRCF